MTQLFFSDYYAGPGTGRPLVIFGAGGLGREVWSAIQRLEAGRGFQAGIAIAVLAIILDRITQQVSRRAQPR